MNYESLGLKRRIWMNVCPGGMARRGGSGHGTLNMRGPEHIRLPRCPSYLGFAKISNNQSTMESCVLPTTPLAPTSPSKLRATLSLWALALQMFLAGFRSLQMFLPGFRSPRLLLAPTRRERGPCLCSGRPVSCPERAHCDDECRRRPPMPGRNRSAAGWRAKWRQRSRASSRETRRHVRHIGRRMCGDTEEPRRLAPTTTHPLEDGDNGVDRKDRVDGAASPDTESQRGCAIATLRNAPRRTPLPP